MAKPKAGKGKKGARQTKKKVKKNIPLAQVHVQATFNNTIITFTDPDGNAIAWSSSGSHGFAGSKKGTGFAAQIAAQAAARTARDNGVREVDVKVKGPGAGRESSIRAIQGVGINIRSIQDVTPIPHNGCRPRKRRRV